MYCSNLKVINFLISIMKGEWKFVTSAESVQDGFRRIAIGLGICGGIRKNHITYCVSNFIEMNYILEIHICFQLYSKKDFYLLKSYYLLCFQLYSIYKLSPWGLYFSIVLEVCIQHLYLYLDLWRNSTSKIGLTLQDSFINLLMYLFILNYCLLFIIIIYLFTHSQMKFIPPHSLVISFIF